MLVALHNLPAGLERGLREALPAAGHELVGEGPAEAEALVAGLGELAPAPAVELDAKAWAEVLAAVRSAFFAARDLAAARLAADGGGRLVFVVDPSSQRVLEGGVAAAVAGAFLSTVAEVAAVELAPRGITANLLVAGWSAPRPAALAAAVPAGRLAEPADVTAACAFLLSPDAAYVNGATLAIDGGYRITKAAGESPLAGSS
jgi:3-oxoacyl-[acyl-carrier protein] reductase